MKKENFGWFQANLAFYYEAETFYPIFGFK